MSREKKKKPYYKAYVDHMLKFYVRYPHMEKQKNKVNELNWKAVDWVFQDLSDYERNVLRCLYQKEPSSEHMLRVAVIFNVAVDKLDCQVDQICKRVAKRRGLL